MLIEYGILHRELSSIRKSHRPESSSGVSYRLDGMTCRVNGLDQDEIVTMVSTGTKTAADAARLFNVHPATVSRLLASAGAQRVLVQTVERPGILR